MKFILIIAALATSCYAGTPVLVKVSAEKIAELQRNYPMDQLPEKTNSEFKATTPENQSIINDSMILHDGNNWTLVPKGAVLHMPQAHQDRVHAKPVGKLLEWSDFLRLNRSWITTCEVNFDQAAGNEAIPQERSVFWSKQDKIVVAVHQQGPISVHLAAKPSSVTH